MAEAQAILSCVACRKEKRRCDRVFPICNLCRKKDIQCEYPERRKRKARRSPGAFTSLSSDSISSVLQSYTLSEKLDALDREQYHPADEFPGTFFLAPEIFRAARLEIPRPKVAIPQFVLDQVGDVDSIRDVAKNYFVVIHPWWPIISKRRFQHYLFNPLSQRRAELYLLAMSMKLATAATRDFDRRLYDTAKRFVFEFEASGLLSIHVLHAAILIAICELGQGIYPAAYMSVGACARYGTALGIDKDVKDRFSGGHQALGDELEERRRTWWCILILDRFILMSDPSRSMTTEDPDEMTYLPVEDDAFDNGDFTSESPSRVGDALLTGRFGRLAQAVHLLSRTLRHVRRDPSTDPLCREEENQLRRTLFALLELSKEVSNQRRLELCDQSAVCYSSILLLEKYARLRRIKYDNVIIEEEGMSFSHETSIVLEAGALTVARILAGKNTPDGKDIIDCMSIFAVYFAYQASMTYARYRADKHSPVFDRDITEWKQFLRLCGRRWRVADIYLSIIQAQEQFPDNALPTMILD